MIKVTEVKDNSQYCMSCGISDNVVKIQVTTRYNDDNPVFTTIALCDDCLLGNNGLVVQLEDMLGLCVCGDRSDAKHTY